MTRTPDEIKKGLECCIGGSCEPGCPYDNPVDCGYGQQMIEDALALIQQLEAQNAEKDARIQQLEVRAHQLDLLNSGLLVEKAQLEAERDAAVRDIEQIVKSPYVVAYCDYCKYGDNEEECAKRNCFRNRNDFEWRGVQKEDMNE